MMNRNSRLLLVPLFAAKTRALSANLAQRASSSHQLTAALALVKSEERDSFAEAAARPVTALQGIGPKHAAELKSLGIETVRQLADYKFFHLARAIDTLGDAEEPGGRLEGAALNIDKGVDKEHEHLHFKDILDAPVCALQGISEEKGGVWKKLGCSTVKDLARFKYARWAEAITVAAKYEQAPKEDE